MNSLKKIHFNLKGEANKSLLFIFLCLVISGCQFTIFRTVQSESTQEIVDKPVVVPQKCFQTAAKMTFQNSKGVDSRFGSCKTSQGFPARGSVIKKLDAVYFEHISESFNTLTKCLAVKNPKNLIPKFTGESGFYPNALGPFKELGVGQLTEAAILDVLPHLKKYRRQLEASADQSCRDFAADQELWSESSFDQGCALASDELSARKNILYSLVYHKLLSQWIANDFKKYSITNDLMALRFFPTAESELSIPAWTLDADRYHVADLQGVMTAISYNVGSRGIVVYLKDYLSRKLEAASHIKKSDFNFKEDLSWINALSKEQLANIKINDLTFPGYLKLYQRWGHPGYGPDMMKLIYKFNETAGFHVCTPERIEGFLAL